MDIEYLADYTQEEKKEWVAQLILTLMDYTEQSDDETFWCDLYDKYKSLKEKHVIIDQQRSIERQYKKEIGDIFLRNGSAMEKVECLNKYFVETPYFVRQIELHELDNILMVSPIGGKPTADELEKVRAIENVLYQIKSKIKSPPSGWRS